MVFPFTGETHEAHSDLAVGAGLEVSVLGALLILLEKERGPKTYLQRSPSQNPPEPPAQQEMLLMGVLEEGEGDGPRGQ